MKHTEIEQKFHVKSHDELREKLRKHGAKKSGSQRQVDTYYNAPHRDFLADGRISEWLRLREENGQSSVTFKRYMPLHDPVKTHCDEFESALSDGEAMRKLFEALQFSPLIVVDKQRETWLLDGIEVALDFVKDLGTFVEFEFKGEAESVEEAHAQISACLTKLGVELGDSHTGYPHQLMKKQLS